MTNPTNATVNGARAVSVRLLTPWTGVWLADVDLDPDDATDPPAGAVTLAIGTATLQGTVDPRGSGRFVDKVHLRIVGGAGGWDQPAPRQQFHNDGGVNSSDVYQSTAIAAGETVNVPTPTLLAIDFTRVGTMPAAAVFGDVDWYVDLTGVTQVASRPTATPDPSLEILDYVPLEQRVEVACDAIVLPGTTLTDARFDGTLVVRDVEQIFDDAGSRATLLCSAAAVGRLTSALKAMVREFSGSKFLQTYRYRYVSATADRLNLQAVNATTGVPDLLTVSVWPGMAGLSATFTPSQTALVKFLEGDPGQPVVVSFDGTAPVELDLQATAKVTAFAPLVELGDASAQPLIPALWGTDLVVALVTFATAVQGDAALKVVAPITVAAAATLVTALGALPPGATTKVKAT